jgi:hypothetical protein
MRVIICGGRHYRGVSLIRTVVAELPPDTVVITGKGGNTDQLAHRFAAARGLATEEVPADWEAPCRADCRPGHRRRHPNGGGTFCPAAGNYRNQVMLDEHGPVDEVIALPGGTGTADMKWRARAADVPVREVGP